MIPSIKAEFRKLLTVRSTYIVTVLAIALIGLFAFYGEGIRLAPASLKDPLHLMNEAVAAVTFLAPLAGVIAIYLMTDEYRHNTIMYTLTANTRSKVLLAKIVTVTTYAVIFTLLLSVLAPVGSYLGIKLAGHTLVPQHFYFAALAWKLLFFIWSYVMAALLIALLIRHQAGSLVTLFVVPGIVESLLALLLRRNAAYLPFTAHGQILPGEGTGNPSVAHLSPGKAATVFGIYLLVGWVVTWILFLKRDAN